MSGRRKGNPPSETKPKGKKTTKSKAPVEPQPTYLNHAVILQAWIEGQVMVHQLYDCLSAVHDVFRKEPNHRSTFHFSPNNLWRVVQALGNVLEEMQGGPLLTDDHFPDPLSREEPE